MSSKLRPTTSAKTNMTTPFVVNDAKPTVTQFITKINEYLFGNPSINKKGEFNESLNIKFTNYDMNACEYDNEFRDKLVQIKQNIDKIYLQSKSGVVNELPETYTLFVKKLNDIIQHIENCVKESELSKLSDEAKKFMSAIRDLKNYEPSNNFRVTQLLATAKNAINKAFEGDNQEKFNQLIATYTKNYDDAVELEKMFTTFHKFLNERTQFMREYSELNEVVGVEKLFNMLREPTQQEINDARWSTIIYSLIKNAAKIEIQIKDYKNIQKEMQKKKQNAATIIQSRFRGHTVRNDDFERQISDVNKKILDIAKEITDIYMGDNTENDKNEIKENYGIWIDYYDEQQQKKHVGGLADITPEEATQMVDNTYKDIVKYDKIYEKLHHEVNNNEDIDCYKIKNMFKRFFMGVNKKRAENLALYIFKKKEEWKNMNSEILDKEVEKMNSILKLIEYCVMERTYVMNKREPNFFEKIDIEIIQLKQYILKNKLKERLSEIANNNKDTAYGKIINYLLKENNNKKYDMPYNIVSLLNDIDEGIKTHNKHNSDDEYYESLIPKIEGMTTTDKKHAIDSVNAGLGIKKTFINFFTRKNRTARRMCSSEIRKDKTRESNNPDSNNCSEEKYFIAKKLLDKVECKSKIKPKIDKIHNIRISITEPTGKPQPLKQAANDKLFSQELELMKQLKEKCGIKKNQLWGGKTRKNVRNNKTKSNKGDNKKVYKNKTRK